MLKCPITECGRQFENQLTMIEHVKRRHPLQQQKIRSQQTNQLLQKQQKITQQMNKLPKMQKIREISKEKKDFQLYRRSLSKQTKQKKPIENSAELKTIENSQIKINQIISQSRQLLEDSNSSKKILKRPSLSKKPSQQGQKLPSIIHSKTKKLKLQSLKSQLSATMNNQASNKNLKMNQSIQIGHTQMYSTAPNFSQMGKKMEMLRLRGKKNEELSNRSGSKDNISAGSGINNMLKKGLNMQTGEGVLKKQINKSTSIINNKLNQRPIKRVIQKATNKSTSDQKYDTLYNNQNLSESTIIQNKIQETVQRQAEKQSVKQFHFQTSKAFPQTLQRKSQHKQILHYQSTEQQSLLLQKQYNWQERVVTIHHRIMETFTIPQSSQVQHLYLTNSKLKYIDLNQCFSLISLTLTHNNISSLSFLEPTINGAYQNLENLYLDHNFIQNFKDLPSSLGLKKFSLIFNSIAGLEDVVKKVGLMTKLEQMDLSFNAVRKQENYKMAIIGACKGLKKLDGMIVTKLDRQISEQYQKLYYIQLNILPVDLQKPRPSTAVSTSYQQQLYEGEPQKEMTEEYLSQQIQKLQKVIKQTKEQLQIIQQENKTLAEETEECLKMIEEQNETEFNEKLYHKLNRELQELEMLNFLQYASEKELQDIISKKLKQLPHSKQVLH